MRVAYPIHAASAFDLFHAESVQCLLGVEDWNIFLEDSQRILDGMEQLPLAWGSLSDQALAHAVSSHMLQNRHAQPVTIRLSSCLLGGVKRKHDASSSSDERDAPLYGYCRKCGPPKKAQSGHDGYCKKCFKEVHPRGG